MKLFHRSQGSTTTNGPAVGCSVLTSEGERMGRVKKVQGGYFELEVPGDPDFWLSSAYIDSWNDDTVRLNVGRQELEEHRLHAPGLSSEQDPHRADNEDHIISDEEALAQRERMERELLAQRGRLDSGLKETDD